MDADNPAAKRRRLNRERQARGRANLTAEQRQTRQATRAQSHANRRLQETLEQSQARHAADALAHTNRRQLHNDEQLLGIQDPVIAFNESQVTRYDCGEMNSICQFCGSQERPADNKFNSCCHKGKVKLPRPLDQHGNLLEYPEFLRYMLSDPADANYKKFRQYIHSYNSSVSPASMGAKIVPAPGNGPYVFKVHGQAYHQTTHVNPPDGEPRKFAQLYVMDSTTQAERTELPENEGCIPALINQIDRLFRVNNRIAASYRLMKEIEQRERVRAEEEGRTVPIVNMVMRRDRQSDQSCYNATTSNEVAMVFVNDDSELPFQRDIRIYPRNPTNINQQFININIISPNLDPMP